jgi:hypothetical protein
VIRVLSCSGRRSYQATTNGDIEDVVFAVVICRVCRLVTLSKGSHLDVVRGPSTPHDPESDAGGSLSSWQRHPSR